MSQKRGMGAPGSTSVPSRGALVTLHPETGQPVRVGLETWDTQETSFIKKKHPARSAGRVGMEIRL